MRTALFSVLLIAGAVRGAEHPYLFWTKEEATAMRKRIESDPLSKKQYEQFVAHESKAHANHLNLFRYGVMGDLKAGAAEKAALMGFCGKLPPPNRPGDPNSGNAAWRDDRTLDALRYDILYDLLSDAERQRVQETIRGYVKWFEENPGCAGSRGDHPRTGWLPNMQWPTMAGIHVLAAASGDEKLIQQVFQTPRGWKWFFDVYIADGKFYMEEFAKYPSNIGSMLLWCEGLHRLGLDQYGWGYKGKNGANMKDYMQMLMWAGYPRIERPGGMPDYPCVTMGDAGTFCVLQGYNADGSRGTPWYHSPKMWGAAKMMQPLWWEIGHRRFPDAGFDYFLAQLRKPDEDVYLPSLYFGLSGIDPKKVKAPPAPSYVTRERGFAMLRMEEGPAYWESPRPAVALQFGMYYVHYVHDCFAMLEYVAHNRYIYQRMGNVRPGYAGNDPWRDHVRGQAGGIVVDGLQIKYVDDGEEGIKNQRLRHTFGKDAKFVAIRAKELYPGTDMERALLLTDPYLFELSWISSDKPRVIDWHVTSAATLKERWTPLEQFAAKDRASKPHLSEIVAMAPEEKAWCASLVQSQMPRGVGVRVRMLGEADTIAAAGKPPIGPGQDGTKLLATRTAQRTVFAVLHEPFADAAPARIETFERIAQNDAGLAARVVGKGIDDRILMRFGDDFQKPLTLAGDDESFTFADFCRIQVTPAKVDVFGDLKAMKLRVTGEPKLFINGQEKQATVAGGIMEVR